MNFLTNSALKISSLKSLLMRPHVQIKESKFISITAYKLYSGEFEMKDPGSPEEIVNIGFMDKEGKQRNIQGKIGDNVLYLAHRYGIELEGACEASLACCTCHVYVSGDKLNKIPPATEKEEDMLDLAPALTVSSRLGCQIFLTKDLEGMMLTLPPMTRNFYVDGHVPKPH